MNKPLVVIFATIVLDAVGIGLIFSILPALLRDVTHVENVAFCIGYTDGPCWALWGSDAFQWNGLWIGLSLGAFGICQTLAQALLPGPVVKLLCGGRVFFTGPGFAMAACARRTGAV